MVQPDWTEAGNAEAVADPQLGYLVRTPGTDANAAVVDVITPVAVGIITATPTVVAAAAAEAQEQVAIALDESDVLVAPRATTKQYIEAIRDSLGNVTWAAQTDGSTFMADIDLSPRGLQRLANDIDALSKSLLTAIAAWGDSLTRGFAGSDWPLTDAWPYLLQQALANGTVVTNGGFSGRTADEVAIWQGGIKLVAQAGFTIPATTDPVTVTVQSGIGWIPGFARSFTGTFNGIAGTFTRASGATTTMSFARTTAGADTVIASGTAFVSSMDTHSAETAIIMVGRNDISNNVAGSDGSVTQHVLNTVQKMVNHLSPQVKRFIIMGPTSASNEVVGSTNHNRVIAINQGLQALYPTRYFNLQSYLVNNVVADLGLPPDPTAVANQTLSPSIMEDTIHWKKTVAVQIKNQLLMQLALREWVA
jgi:lysophospholipase L1-like esterase